MDENVVQCDYAYNAHSYILTKDSLSDFKYTFLYQVLKANSICSEFLLATSNLLQPFISFGVQHALIKFYSSYSTKEDRDNLLWFSIYFPIIIILTLVPFIDFFKFELDFYQYKNSHHLSLG